MRQLASDHQTLVVLARSVFKFNDCRSLLIHAHCQLRLRLVLLHAFLLNSGRVAMVIQLRVVHEADNINSKVVVGYGRSMVLNFVLLATALVVVLVL